MSSRIFAPGLLNGQVAIVSGGGSGLGRATALELASLGARVVVCGRRPEPLKETAAMAEEIEARTCDIREEAEVDALVDGVLDAHGRIDTLVNNAGGQYMAAAEDINPVATRAMMGAGGSEPRGGKIVNVTLSPHHGLPAMAHSSAARAAVENLTRVLSIEWARFEIKLTAIAAGHFETDTLLTKYPKPVVEGMASTVPAQRLGRPEELAWLAAFVASPAGDYLSGAVLTLDGGRDNWFGPWPPGDLADEGGKHLAEERRPKP